MQAGVFVCMLISRILRFISEILLLFRLWLLPYRSSPCRSDGNYRRCIPRVYPAGISPRRPRDGCFYRPRQAHGCNYQKSVGAAARCPRHRACNQPLWQKLSAGRVAPHVCASSLRNASFRDARKSAHCGHSHRQARSYQAPQYNLSWRPRLLPRRRTRG